LQVCRLTCLKSFRPIPPYPVNILRMKSLEPTMTHGTFHWQAGRHLPARRYTQYPPLRIGSPWNLRIVLDRMAVVFLAFSQRLRCSRLFDGHRCQASKIVETLELLF